MKLTIQLLSPLLLGLILAFNVSTVSAATCSVTDVSAGLTGGGSAIANDCVNHSGNDAQINYENDINSDFGLSLSWIRADKDDSVGSLKISSGIWDFSSFTISNPFVIVLKAGNGFAAYLFNADSTGIINWTTLGLDSKDLSHISLYTANVGQVPIPAAVWLFGSALMGLVGIRKRYTA